MRTFKFTPLPVIKEEDDNSSSSQIYQPVPFRISRDILPIEEEEEEEEEEEKEEEENEPPERDNGSVEAPIIIAGIGDEIYEEGSGAIDFDDFISPSVGESPDRKQCELDSLNWSRRFNYCKDISSLEYQIPQYWYDTDDSSSSLGSDSSDSSLY